MSYRDRRRRSPGGTPRRRPLFPADLPSCAAPRKGSRRTGVGIESGLESPPLLPCGVSLDSVSLDPAVRRARGAPTPLRFPPRSMPRTLIGALSCLLFCSLSACRGSGSQPADEVRPSAAERTVAPRAPAGNAAAVSAEAIQCIEDGRFEEARALLDGLLVTERLRSARTGLSEGSPEDALIDIDQALLVAPENEEARLLKADASLRLAEAKIAGGGSGLLIGSVLADALTYYRGLGESAHALFGASRAAWLLGRPDEALELARRGMARRTSDEALPAELGLAPERIYAEPVYAAYAAARTAASEDGTNDEARALFRESEDALSRLLGRTSDDPWAWWTLSDLYEREGQLSDSKGALERGLARAPEDAGLLERLARVSRELDGAAAAVKALEGYTAAHPTVAAGRWYLAVA